MLVNDIKDDEVQGAEGMTPRRRGGGPEILTPGPGPRVRTAHQASPLLATWNLDVNMRMGCSIYMNGMI